MGHVPKVSLKLGCPGLQTQARSLTTVTNETEFMVSLCRLRACLFFCREELMGFAKNSDLLESDLDQLRRELLEEKRHKRKLEKILSDCAQALKTALTVSKYDSILLGLYFRCGSCVPVRSNSLEKKN